MRKVEEILEMLNEEILSKLSQEELELVDNEFGNRNNFCDMYQDGASQSGEEEYFDVNEYLEKILENR